MNEYPKRLYHPTLGTTLVMDPDQHAAKADWFDSPADFPSADAPISTPTHAPSSVAPDAPVPPEAAGESAPLPADTPAVAVAPKPKPKTSKPKPTAAPPAQ